MGQAPAICRPYVPLLRHVLHERAGTPLTPQRGHHFCRREHVTHSREDASDEIVPLLFETGTCIRHNHHVEVQIPARESRRRNPDVRGAAHQQYRVDITRSKRQLETRPMEGTPPVLGYVVITGKWRQLREHLQRKRSRTALWASRRRIIWIPWPK